MGLFSNEEIPCVGVSLGVERIFSILEATALEGQGKLRRPTVQILVASTGGDMLKERLRVCSELWTGRLSAEILPAENPKLTKQIQYALEMGKPVTRNK